MENSLITHYTYYAQFKILVEMQHTRPQICRLVFSAPTKLLGTSFLFKNMEDQRPSCGQGSASQCLSFVSRKGMRSASDLFEPSLNAFASEKLLIHSRISKCFSLCLEVFRKNCINELKPLSVVFYVFLASASTPRKTRQT